MRWQQLVPSRGSPHTTRHQVSQRAGKNSQKFTPGVRKDLATKCEKVSFSFSFPPEAGVACGSEAHPLHPLSHHLSFGGYSALFSTRRREDCASVSAGAISGFQCVCVPPPLQRNEEESETVWCHVEQE